MISIYRWDLFLLRSLKAFKVSEAKTRPLSNQISKNPQDRKAKTAHSLGDPIHDHTSRERLLCSLLS